MTYRKRLSPHLLLMVLAIYVALVFSYMTLRYVGNWAETDTTTITTIITSAQSVNSVLDSPRPYNNGSGYPSISLFLLELTGLRVQVLQTYVFPLIIAISPVVVFVSYRSLTQSSAVALIATFLLFLQPEFLWVNWRGSHEKITWTLVFLLLFLLCRSFVLRRQFRLTLRHMLLFYLMAFALVTSNVFFASSFIAALSLSFAGGFLIFRLRNLMQINSSTMLDQHIKRLFFVTISCSILLFLFMFYIFTPSLSSLRVLNSLIDQLAILFLGAENVNETVTEFNPYAYLSTSWISIQTFVLLTIFNWIVLGFSAIVWLFGSLGLVFKPMNEGQLPRLLLWLMYPAFAMQLAASLFADRSDVLAGNLQVRLFTPLMIVAVLLTALGVHELLTRLSNKHIRRAILIFLIPAVLWFSVAALFKAISDPLLNNHWIFITPPELTAGDWVMQHAQNATVWTGIDERIVVAFGHQQDRHRMIAADIRFDGFALEADNRYFLLSDLELMRQMRRGLPLPNLDVENAIYTNGTTNIYNRRPRTPYQR